MYTFRDPAVASLLQLHNVPSSPSASTPGALLLVSHIIVPVVARRVDSIINMDASENSFRTSVIRPPSNLPRPGISSGLGLSEMSEAQNNSRAQSSMIPPPGARVGSLADLKRNVPQPAQISDPKHRKTLADRAVEYPQKNNTTAATSGLSRSTSVRGQTISSPARSFAMESSVTRAVPLVDVLRITHWICLHLCRASRWMLRTVALAAPRLSTLQKLLLAFSFHSNQIDWHQKEGRSSTPPPNRRPRAKSPAPLTYFRSASGSLQVWLGMQNASGSTRGLQLWLGADMHQGTGEPCIADITDDTGDRDELLSIKGPSTLNRQKSTSAVSRYNSNNTNFSASVGPGRHERSKSSLSNTRSAHAQSVSGGPRPRTQNAMNRPRTAHSNRVEDDFDGPMAQQHGTAKQSQRLKFQGALDFSLNKTQPSNSAPQMPCRREVSLSSRFGALSIKDDTSTDSTQDEDQVVFSSQENSISSMTTAASTTQVADNVTMRGSRRLAMKPPELSPKKRQASRMTEPVTPSPDSKRVRADMNELEDAILSIKASRSPARSPSPNKLMFLTKDSNLTQFAAWDVEGRLGELDSQFKKVQDSMNSMITDKELMDERVAMFKKRISELEAERDKFADRNESLQTELNSMREQVSKLTIESETEKRSHKYELEDEARKRRHEVDELRRELRDEVARQEKSQSEALAALERHYKVMLDDERSKQEKEVENLRMRLGNEQQDLHLSLQKKDREVSEMRAVIEGLKGDLDREQSLKKGLEATITELSSSNHQLQGRINSLAGQVDYLQSDSKAQSDSYTQMEARLQEALQAAEFAQEKLIKEETERRILFNKYQELKGNIRVMCRVRPVLSSSEGLPAQVTFPDDKTSAEIALAGPEETNSISGKVTRKNYNFEFDRVFDPSAQNQDVFDEISQLVQSALDGYNVCIFCYGQTGSGKTHTMSSQDGMIPRATHMIYDTVTKLKEKSWSYRMEGSFIEVYNEELNDLLTPNSRESGGKERKLEIRHDDMRKQTTVVNCKTVSLDSADTVEMMLDEASKNRSVAATKANERSSRSHSVFILKLVGFNSATGERCEGTLNLVDLAGSERLKHSQAEGDRMKETQNINKSLSCLGDVIEALGRGSGHIPYRNSKLTHLLQYSLGGNSKTLMFVMVSPLETHLKETLTSLRFATKVHNTHIGTAKATKKV
ncbi:kinesin family protein [Colletotrichum karsti]|uniref:Kinesin family protein n=1 Tax=Colletotrichum karsti TaxID=1095194 RepID=A0A9P6LG15_9PEZI|nr:kinesin family protein [Colletotrichum karsti]KAF9872053.1 kinesin family protein [Colletotrichum karsti]